MKKHLFYFIVFLAVGLVSCDENSTVGDLPSCIQDEIEGAQKLKQSEASVIEYLYNGERVFGFDPGVVYPDIMSTIVNEDCEVICQFGGIAGLNTCPDFQENAEEIGVVWQGN
ncbi:DUF6970 domain-containing protein [Roseivirga misakiensis]|uniref:DUF6970 domain-containing protein n=1 Tax=Roseivirga misakiensis TaxID=1563681 RepID=A0A1E5T0J3_9BACT|nr:hypothetical protein [Roseivirga misakiensis]OEK04881.1 hypothetical protein BFP71_15695 [Roseivirga misakiensis]